MSQVLTWRIPYPLTFPSDLLTFSFLWFTPIVHWMTIVDIGHYVELVCPSDLCVYGKFQVSNLAVKILKYLEPDIHRWQCCATLEDAMQELEIAYNRRFTPYKFILAGDLLPVFPEELDAELIFGDLSSCRDNLYIPDPIR